MKIILLQGPVGGFFAFLTRHLRARGHEVRKFDFNGGDRLYSFGSGTTGFSGSLDDWAAFVRAELASWRPDAVIMFGDERPIHRIAAAAARAAAVAVFSFEEGYFRPHHITFEAGGNNANSPLPRDPSAYGNLPEPPPPPLIGPAFGPMGRRATLYYCAKTLGRPFLGSPPHHRERDPFSEGLFWARSFARKFKAEWIDRKVAKTLLSGKGPGFFLAALQVHDDLQLRRHGGPWSHSRFIPEVIASFAGHAPPSVRLVFKVHPLDRGHKDYRRSVNRAARKAGVGHRVIVLETGALAPLVRHAQGLITVNSTSGLTALMAGVPVAVLGRAFYAIPGLATAMPDIQALDSFWSAPPTPDPDLAQRFSRKVIWDCLIPGSFYLKHTWPTIAQAAEDRLRAALNQPKVAGVTLEVNCVSS